MWDAVRERKRKREKERGRVALMCRDGVCVRGGEAALSDGGRDTSHYDDEGDSIHVMGEMNEGE